MTVIGGRLQDDRNVPRLLSDGDDATWKPFRHVYHTYSDSPSSRSSDQALKPTNTTLSPNTSSSCSPFLFFPFRFHFSRHLTVAGCSVLGFTDSQKRIEERSLAVDPHQTRTSNKSKERPARKAQHTAKKNQVGCCSSLLDRSGS